MGDTTIRMNLDSSGIVSGARQGADSIGELAGALSNISEAASKALTPEETQRVLADVQKLNSEVQNLQRNMPGFNGGITGALNNQQINSTGKSEKELRADEINRLKLTIDNLNRNIEKANASLAEATESNKSKESFNWSANLNQMEEAKQRAQNELRRLEAADKKDSVGALLNERKAQLWSQGWNYAVQGANIYNGYRTSIANGDYLGAGANAKDQIGGAAMGIGGTLMSAGGMMAVTGVGVIPGLIVGGIGALATGVGGILKLIAGDEQADNAEANAYEKSLPALNAFNKRFVNNGDWKDNAERTDSLRIKMEEAARGTGLSTYDFANAATQFAAYGSVSKDTAIKRTRMAALWANSTGADVNTVADVIGTSNRMGKYVDTGYLSQVRNATAMTKAQTQEFLTSLQSIVESGISNGYAKSTKDVAENFVMFSRLSDDNPLWEGKYAASKINTINSGIASATNLGDVNQVITVETAKNIVDGMKDSDFMNALNTKYGKTGTYIDYMMMTENGLTPKMFNGIGKAITSLEGDNLAARVERWKSISGLNYKGAYELDRMYQKGGMSESEIASTIDSMRKDNDYKSEETKKMDMINSIDINVQKIGQSKFWDNLDKLEAMQSEYTGLPTTKTKEGDNYGQLTTVTEGQEIEAANAALNDKNIQTGRKGVRGDTPLSVRSTTYKNLIQAEHTVRLKQRGVYTGKTYTEGGNDSRDNLFKERFAKYAALDDGKISTGELMKALTEHDKPEMQKLYKEGSDRAYFDALEAMLTRLFGSITAVRG